MKSINNMKKLFFCLSIAFLFYISQVSSLRNLKEKTETESERKKSKTSAKTKVSTSMKENAHNTNKEKSSISSSAEVSNKTLDKLSLSAYRQLNQSSENIHQDLANFVQKNRNWDFKVLDRQLQDIAIDMNFQQQFGNTPAAIRSFIKYFINYFESCDKDADNMLSRTEFASCLKNDSFLSKIDIPDKRFASVQSKSINFTNFTDYSEFLFNLLDSHHMDKLNFYDYMTLRLLTFSWTKCSVAAPFIEEANFECAIEVASGWKTMQRNQVRKLFFTALELSGSSSIRNIDFLTYSNIALSVRLYGKINGKEDNDATRNEMNLALDNNVLPMRYNQDIVNQLFQLSKDADKENQGIDLISFVFYDFWLKIFDLKNAKSRYHLTADEFVIACSTPLYPSSMLDSIEKIPQNLITSDSYQMYTYLNMNNYNDESDHFLKAFIESDLKVELKNSKEKYLKNLKNRENNKWSIKEAAVNISLLAFNSTTTLQNIFNIIDNEFDGLINFYDFGSFIQINYIFSKFDKYKKGRIPAGQVAEDFHTYSEYPVIARTFKERSKRFTMLPIDLYVDLSSATLILRLDDIIDATVRRSDKSTLFEVELKNIFSHINRRYTPDSFLNKCLRGNSQDNIPLYDWECAFIQTESKTLAYLESSLDYLTTKTQNITLFNTVFVNKDALLDK